MDKVILLQLFCSVTSALCITFVYWDSDCLETTRAICELFSTENYRKSY